MLAMTRPGSASGVRYDEAMTRLCLLPKNAGRKTLEYYDESVWEPIKYNTRGSVFRGTVTGARGRRSSMFGGIGGSI